MHVILMGAQGAGKGTQAARLAPRLGLVHLSTGDLFRNAIADQTDLGRLAQRYLDRGELVPDGVTIDLVDARLNQISERQLGNGAVFDGFPRTPAQAAGLDELLARRGELIAAVIEIQAPIPVLVERLAGRRVCKSCGATYHILFDPPKVEGVCDRCGGAVIQRSDDTPEAIQRRLDLYAELTAPLLGYYQERGLLSSVDGNADVDVVTEALERIAQEAMKRGSRAG